MRHSAAAAAAGWSLEQACTRVANSVFKPHGAKLHGSATQHRAWQLLQLTLPLGRHLSTSCMVNRQPASLTGLSFAGHSCICPA